DSFWEGVDTPGESLRVVIICRLPFQVPNDPVVEARYERILARNGNPFIELSLPVAVTRLKQGFGRLMRRTTDRGAVVILDPRMLKKQYGNVFVESLPDASRSFKERKGILRDIEANLYTGHI
ncbi:MAG: ATP-dependent DNA helicase DinG, partial [Spirochaetales bacterium]|nr:ATP-dependent DNA helicase DinG [Spirochaetales bacterium]